MVINMQLKIWLNIERISVAEFAKKIGKHHSLVHKYVYEGVIPGVETMRIIYQTTRKALDANDFNGLSDEIFKSELNDRKSSIAELEMDFSL